MSEEREREHDDRTTRFLEQLAAQDATIARYEKALLDALESGDVLEPTKSTLRRALEGTE
jgi:hypothetical protein